MSAGLACTKDLFFTRDTTETPGRTAMAAPPYGEQPHDAAAADARDPVDAAGWSRTVVADSATSRKHPVSTTVEKGASSDGRKGSHAITMEG